MVAPLGPRSPLVLRRRTARTMGRDAGYVTAETALVLPAVAVVATLLVWMLAVGAAQLRCVDAARTAARDVARGEPPGQVADDVRAAAPVGAVFSVSDDGRLLRARVAVRVPLPGPLGRAGLAVDLSGTAFAEPEMSLPQVAVCGGCHAAPPGASAPAATSAPRGAAPPGAGAPRRPQPTTRPSASGRRGNGGG